MYKLQTPYQNIFTYPVQKLSRYSRLTIHRFHPKTVPTILQAGHCLLGKKNSTVGSVTLGKGAKIWRILSGTIIDLPLARMDDVI